MHRNNVFDPIADFVKEKLYEDEELHCEVAKLKMDFMTRAQSLIHGDLHTGSIFINEEVLWYLTLNSASMDLWDMILEMSLQI